MLSFDITTGLLEGSDLQAEGPIASGEPRSAMMRDPERRTTCNARLNQPTFCGDAARRFVAAGDSAITYMTGVGCRLELSVAEEFELRATAQ